MFCLARMFLLQTMYMKSLMVQFRGVQVQKKKKKIPHDTVQRSAYIYVFFIPHGTGQRSVSSNVCTAFFNPHVILAMDHQLKLAPASDQDIATLIQPCERTILVCTALSTPSTKSPCNSSRTLSCNCRSLEGERSTISAHPSTGLLALDPATVLQP